MEDVWVCEVVLDMLVEMTPLLGPDRFPLSIFISCCVLSSHFPPVSSLLRLPLLQPWAVELHP